MIDKFIHAARLHGENSESDHEIGDLQEGLLIAWSLMSKKQRREFSRNERVLEILEELDDEGS